MEASMEDQQLAKILKGARLGKGYTEAQIGSILGVSHVSVSHWENSRLIPKDRHLRAIAAEFDLNLEELLNMAQRARCDRELVKLEARYKDKFRASLLAAAERVLQGC